MATAILSRKDCSLYPWFGVNFLNLVNNYGVMAALICRCEVEKGFSFRGPRQLAFLIWKVVVQKEPGGCDGVEQRLGIIAALMEVCFRKNGRAQLGDGQRLQDRFNNPAQAEQKHPS
eukprot:3200732-Pleurochrysis_carterae.AAC.1